MARKADAPLQTLSGKPSSVLKVLDEVKQRWSQCEEPRTRARALERYVYGRLTSWRGYSLESQVNLRSALYAPPIQKNKTKNALLSWVSKILGAGTTTLVYPSKATDIEISKSDVANAVLDWQRQTQDMDAMQYRALMLAGMHGMSAYYTTWDPDDGPHIERVPVLMPDGINPVRDIAGQVVYQEQRANGAPHVEALSLFDFVTDGQPDVQRHGKWCAVRRFLDVDEATARLREAGIGRDATATPVQNRQAHGATYSGVESWEIWWRPGPRSRFPEGFQATIIDGDVTDATTFPYKHGLLPLIPVRTMDVEDDFWGATWMEDAVPQQMGLNRALQVLAHRVEITGSMRRLAYGPAHTEWDEAPDGAIDVGSKEGLESVAWSQTPEIPRDLYELCDRFEKGIDDTANASEMTTNGDAAAATKNARLVYNATQVDQLKSAMTVKNSNEATVARDTQILELCRQFINRQRLFSIVGEDGIVAASYFQGDEIGGVVRLEVASSTERSPAQHGADIDTDMQMGMMDPQTGGELRQTGLEQTADQTAMRERLQVLISSAMHGQPVQADPSIPPEIAIPDLRRALADNAQSGPKATMPIRALLQEYEELKAQGAQMGGQPGQAPPQGPQGGAQQKPAQPGAKPGEPQPLVH